MLAMAVTSMRRPMPLMRCQWHVSNNNTNASTANTRPVLVPQKACAAREQKQHQHQLAPQQQQQHWAQQQQKEQLLAISWVDSL